MAAQLRSTLPVQPPGPSPSPAPWAPWCVSSHLPLLLPLIRPPWPDPWRFESSCLGSSPWPVQPGTGTTHSSPPGSHQAFVTSDIPSPQLREQPPLFHFSHHKRLRVMVGVKLFIYKVNTGSSGAGGARPLFVSLSGLESSWGPFQIRELPFGSSLQRGPKFICLCVF